MINSIHVVEAGSVNVGVGKGWWGEFYWDAGPGPAGRSSQLVDTSYRAGGCCSEQGLESRSIGWFVQCEAKPACANGVALEVGELDLTAEENTGPNALPAAAAGNLWAAPGWIRGTWSASLALSDPSGVCAAEEAFGSQTAVVGTQTPNRHTFVQCSESSLPASFNTASITASQGVGVGSATLQLLATNAAGVTSHPARTIQIDNTVPTISLAGPTNAPSTAGTQYVTATAGGSPSGIAQIVCSEDGGPDHEYGGSAARVPVSGVGQHSISCFAQNNAVDPSGAHGQSPAASRSMKIGQPTTVGIGFRRFVGLDCVRRAERVRIPGRWVTVHRHGIPVWVKTRTVIRTRIVVHCHLRTVARRTVFLKRVKRHGHVVTVREVKVVRVVVAPHVVDQSAQRVGFGQSTNVSGWLGTTAGTPLAGRHVEVLAAPDNGLGSFAVITQTTTAADGSWTAHLPAGPSRVVEAVYGGDETTEGAFSSQVRVVVAARIRLLSVSPTHVPWGGTVHITGQLVGGYLPPSGTLVRLRIGIGRSYQTYGVDHVAGSGRFSTTYTFGLGEASVHRSYFFQIATLPEGDYPFAPGASGRRTVQVGGR